MPKSPFESAKLRRAAPRCLRGLLALCCVCGWPSVSAGQQYPSIEIRLIEGMPCARCTIAGPAGTIPANVVLDLGLDVHVLVHERTARLLGLGRQARVSLSFDKTELSDLPAGATGLAVLERLTRDHADELQEIPAVAIVGLPAFAAFRPQLDLGKRVLNLLPSASADGPDQVEAAGSAQDVVAVPYEAREGGYWLSGRGPDDFPLRVRISTAQHDTIIDAGIAELLGAPGGDLDSLWIGELDVARFVALRPEELALTQTSPPDAVLGTGLLASFRVTIDPQQRVFYFEQVAEPRFPTEERDYFIARTHKDAEAIEAFLQSNLSSRLATEASDVLLELRLNEDPPDREAVGRAMRMAAESRPENRRASAMLRLADTLLGRDPKDSLDLAAGALGIGMSYAQQDLNARAAHEIHARMGLLALRHDDLQQARRHLLSAAFGMPRDPMVNLWLGELYERSGKLARAWSRYIQAVIADASLSEAQAGLDRLNRNAAFRAAMNMSDAEQLLEGRVPEFHPASRYDRGSHGSEGPPVQLVELFTCLDLPQTTAAELAFAGLQEYFAGAGVVFVQYHLPASEPDPLASAASLDRAAFYGVESTPIAVIDGIQTVATGGDEEAAAAVFAEYRAACGMTTRPQEAWELAGNAFFEDGEVAARIELNGPRASDSLRLVAVLCEPAVMVPGGNTLILHHQVARYSMSPAGGFAIAPEPGRRVFALATTRDQVEGDIEQLVAQIEKEHGIRFRMRPTYVDVGSCVIAAFLQDQPTKRILAACEIAVQTNSRPDP